ncbi:MAG TPA: PilC/PilY family type IV pilus protein [Syntrophales bacterium]|nr:PilC/PilY family type IV pilus protein [Syntrophales bacterium]
MKRSACFLLMLFVCLVLPLTANAQEDEADESALFTSLAPDALIVLDLSGSMNWAAAGEYMYAASCSSDGPFYNDPAAGLIKCTISTTNVPKYGTTNCDGAFYKTSHTGYTTNCSRLSIAKRGLFEILDDNNDTYINLQDSNSLGIRLGYMRYYNCGSDESGSYSSGCNMVLKTIDTKYSSIYCGKTSSCSTTDVGSSSTISGATATGGTPLAGALTEAKSYLDYHKNTDSAALCRSKFAILITDGADTFACSGNGQENQVDQYKRRRAFVEKARALSAAGYRTFVIGFGAAMPHFLKNTLNWAAYLGGTDNPQATNTGNPTAYTEVTSPCTAVTVTSGSQCLATADYNAANSICYHTLTGEEGHYYSPNDPGELSLSGYAFIASNPAELSSALKAAFTIIREATYSFSQASVQSTRTQDENFIYEGSFQPVTNDPFWLGHLRKYNINTDGSVGSVVWNAGTILQSRGADTRTMYTYVGGALTAFTTSIARSYFNADSDAERNMIVGYLRGESAYNFDYWKLGDVFRSNPITISTPSSFFNDTRDANNAFSAFRSSHARTSAIGNRVILAGANDAQMHAFKTSDGEEAWSFIPPNFLYRLKSLAHSTHPTLLAHAYYVDGQVTVSEYWTGSGDGTSKTSTDWKSILVFGLGRGGSTTLWSSSASCDTGFNSTYSTTYSNYCGFYALNVTNPLTPTYLWRIMPSSTQAPYLGDPWSRMQIGRVSILGNEKWVGFIGAGYNASECAGGGTCDPRGKGFYIIDLADGTVLWSYTRSDNTNMNYSLPAPPAIADTDNDNFIDTVYIGDLGGSMWRFKMCSAADLASNPYCTTSSWSGGYLFAASTGTIRPIFTSPAVAKDKQNNLWIYWGTGDKSDPTASNAQEKFFGLKDNDRTTSYSINDLENITTGTYDTASTTKKGWYINLAGQGEKMLADPTVYGGVVYFTSYTPPIGSDLCSQAGTAKLYGVNYTTGGAALTTSTGTARSVTLGVGIPSAPVISLKPGSSPVPDLYVTVSGGAGTGASTMRADINPVSPSNRTNMLYWRDRRLQ